MNTHVMSVGDIVETDHCRYELVRILGRGGMGEVWEALDLQRGGYVAIKFMIDGHQELCRRFRREGRVLQRLAHPSIVQFIDVGETEGQKPFLVLERLYGQTLREKLETSGKLSPREAIAVGHAIAGALKIAHEVGVVHRDLKPSNVFIQDEPGTRRRTSDVKLIDFGIAKDTLFANHTNVTAPGTLLGSLRYMSPEQISADVVDHRSDLWSLGVLLYEMLQGEALFVGSAPYVSHAVLNDTIHPIPWRRIVVPKKIDALIRRCLQRDLSQRINSAEELEKELARLLHASDDELEIIDVSVDGSSEKTYELPRQSNSLLPPASDAVAITIRKELEEIERRTGERHRQLMRMHIIAFVGLALILTLAAFAVWQVVLRPWDAPRGRLEDRNSAKSPMQTPVSNLDDRHDSSAVPVPVITLQRHISGCRY